MRRRGSAKLATETQRGEAMGWLIAIGTGQLIVLVYIAFRVELLLKAEQAGILTDLILGPLNNISGWINKKKADERRAEDAYRL